MGESEEGGVLVVRVCGKLGAHEMYGMIIDLKD